MENEKTDWRDGLSAEHIRACEEAARLAPVRIPQPAADSGAHKPEGDKGDGSEGVHRLSLGGGVGGARRRTALKLGPDFSPVLRAEIAARVFAAALFLHASAVRDGDAVPPTIHGLP